MMDVKDNTHLFKKDEEVEEVLPDKGSDKSKPEAAKEQDPGFRRMVITLYKNKPLEVSGHINEPATSILMLNLAEDVLKRHWALRQEKMQQLVSTQRKPPHNRTKGAFGGNGRG